MTTYPSCTASGKCNHGNEWALARADPHKSRPPLSSIHRDSPDTIPVVLRKGEHRLCVQTAAVPKTKSRASVQPAKDKEIDARDLAALHREFSRCYDCGKGGCKRSLSMLTICSLGSRPTIPTLAMNTAALYSCFSIS